jgi:serine/threonine protein kinase
MPLHSGTQLGPYEILEQIGAGGMGLVYKARDQRLDRDVAIKILPRDFAEDSERLRRFEQEVRTTGNLNHPNILAVYDTGTHEGEPYFVMELLVGETLRDRLVSKALSPRKALEIAIQVAQGLAAAHEKGIVHRDLKPDNLFLLRDGRVKILDFGLAKPAPEASPLSTSDSTRALEMPPEVRSSGKSVHTAVGIVVGTMGYMSPEQVRGERVDGRSDLFCLGVILWEMLTGRPLFSGNSAVEVMYAILREDPPELDSGSRLPPMLQKIVQRCLAKDPVGRFQSAQDLAFALDAAMGSSMASNPGLELPAPKPAPRPSKRRWIAAGIAALLLLGGGAWALGRWIPRAPAPPSFQRLTFSPGLVDAARFSADGRSIYFSARFQGRPPELFVRSPESPEPRPIEAQGAQLLDVSSTNRLAVLKALQPSRSDFFRGLLAEMPGGGGPCRDIQEDVLEAAWDPEGEAYAILASDPGYSTRLEFPIGTPLYSTSVGVLKCLRVSRGDLRIALIEGTGTASVVAVFTPSGQRRVLFQKNLDLFATTLTGLAWHPGGQELWLSELQGSQTVFWALSMKGRQRLVWRGPGDVRLLDIAPNGQVLAADRTTRLGVLVQKTGETTVKDLSIQSGTQAVGFSPDGASLLLLESPSEDGGTDQDLAYLRSLDGSPAVRLGQGIPRSFSTDGRYVSMGLEESAPSGSLSLVFTPVGAGRPLKIPVGSEFEGWDDGLLFDNGKKLIFAGLPKGQDWQFYCMELPGGKPKAFTPVGIRAPRPLLLSPDGRFMIGSTTTRGQYARYPVAGGDPQPIRGLQPRETPIAWSADGRSILVTGPQDALPVRIHSLDPVSGQRRLVHTFMPPDPAGYLGTCGVRARPDGGAFAFTYDRRLSDLYLVEGLK